MANDLTISKGLLQTEDSEYVRLVSLISGVWDKAREKAALSVNTELLDASWATGRYIVEYEQNTKESVNRLYSGHQGAASVGVLLLLL